jgi:hypothetical protein
MLSFLRDSRPGFSGHATGCEQFRMFRPLLLLGLRRFAVVALISALGAAAGCQMYDQPTSGISEQAAKFGAYQRPKTNPRLRFGVSPEAQQIEQDFGY